MDQPVHEEAKRGHENGQHNQIDPLRKVWQNNSPTSWEGREGGKKGEREKEGEREKRNCRGEGEGRWRERRGREEREREGGKEGGEWK